VANRDFSSGIALRRSFFARHPSLITRHRASNRDTAIRNCRNPQKTKHSPDF
jgi:hypothetical protein